MNRFFQWVWLIVCIAAVEVFIGLAFKWLIDFLLVNELPAAPVIILLPLFSVGSAAVLAHVLLPEEKH